MPGERGTRPLACWLAFGCLLGGGLVACVPAQVADCPQQYTAGVVWSSETSRPSWLHFTDDTGQLNGALSIDVQGMATMLDGTPLHRGDQFVLLSTGNTVKDQSHVIAVDVAACTARPTRIQEPSVFAVVDAEEGYVTTNWLNGNAELHRYRADGQHLAVASFPQVGIWPLTRRDGLIYAFKTEEMAGNKATLLVLNEKDLTLRTEVPLPLFGSNAEGPGNAEIVGNELFFTVLTGSGGAPDTRLWVIDLTTFEVTTLELGVESPPNLLHAVGDTLYIGHGDVVGTRQLTVLETASRQLSHHELATPIDRMDANATTLAVISGGAGQPVSLSTYRLPEVALQQTVSLPPPQADSDAYYYAANVFVP